MQLHYFKESPNEKRLRLAFANRHEMNVSMQTVTLQQASQNNLNG
jgi:hypothetical protein